VHRLPICFTRGWLIVLLLVESAMFSAMSTNDPLSDTIFYLTIRAVTIVAVLRRTDAAAVDGRHSMAAACCWCMLYPYVAYAVSEPNIAGSGTIERAVLVLSSALSIGSIMSLGSSFGVRPAKRELVTGGLYACVRHPLYLSYLLTDCMLLLSTVSSVAVMTVIGTGWAALLFRLAAEERMLTADQRWVCYAQSVRFKLVPGIF
jgi:protein-S-isoprenylcysteine O-methyltransferase Ste14